MLNFRSRRVSSVAHHHMTLFVIFHVLSTYLRDKKQTNDVRDCVAIELGPQRFEEDSALDAVYGLLKLLGGTMSSTSSTSLIAATLSVRAFGLLLPVDFIVNMQLIAFRIYYVRVEHLQSE